MGWWIWLFWGYAGLVLLSSLWLLYAAIQTVRHVPVLMKLENFPSARWPKLSILVAACNEEDNIEDAVRSLLETDYPELEILVMNDRSTDKTGAILDRISEDNPHLRVKHIQNLPEGWLGKVHALYRGYQDSLGDWILLLDADVHLEKDSLRHVIAWCEQEKIDHATLIPYVWRTGLAEASWWSLGYLFLLLSRLWKVSDSESKAHAGIGAFNLIRRSAFEKTEGFRWFKLDVADDWALGLLMKKSGKRCAIANGRGLVSLPWYGSFSQMVTGLEKNSFAIMGQYSFARCIAIAVISVLLILGPYFLLLMKSFSGLFVTGIIAVIAMHTASFLIHIWLRRPFYQAFLFPVGIMINAFIFLRAGYSGWKRGGVTWRGTFYSSKIMKAEMKVKF